MNLDQRVARDAFLPECFLLEKRLAKSYGYDLRVYVHCNSAENTTFLCVRVQCYFWIHKFELGKECTIKVAVVLCFAVILDDSRVNL